MSRGVRTRLMAPHRWLVPVAAFAVLCGSTTSLAAQTPPPVDSLHTQQEGARPQGASADGAAAARGKGIFEGKGACQTCHRVNGVGSRVAPDLSSIGATLAADA